ncbi:hypothetical protein LTR62_008732 [Meristemomyces frigidus]|uniref:Uncharacterized protein n=1 Tax=Meristemomyces frigidus TaxID=1508187 RepID=A0AAN7TKL4_9PEZI|nr:hypothetical protein LTR62_008732 [Meristemomyces frigidus]
MYLANLETKTLMESAVIGGHITVRAVDCDCSRSVSVRATPNNECPARSHLQLPAIIDNNGICELDTLDDEYALQTIAGWYAGMESALRYTLTGVTGETKQLRHPRSVEGVGRHLNSRSWGRGEGAGDSQGGCRALELWCKE